MNIYIKYVYYKSSKAKGPLYEVCQFKEESAFGSLEQSLRS